MSQTTTQVGRAKLNHPDLSFDTEIDDGVALHEALTLLWATVSNYIATRWTGQLSLVSNSSVTINHNFGLSFEKLKIIIFESGNQLNSIQIAQSYLITQVDVNSIQIKNISLATKTFDVTILSFRYQHTAEDEDGNTLLPVDLNSKEGKFINGIMTKTQNAVKNIQTDDPMKAIMGLMQSGVLTDLMGGLKAGVEGGEMDPNKLMDAMQGMLASARPKTTKKAAVNTDTIKDIPLD